MADVAVQNKATGAPVGLLQATSAVMVATLSTAVLGVVRAMMVAAYFGTSSWTDAYFFSFDLMVSLPEFLLGAISGSLIPIYTRGKSEGQSDRFASTVINAYVLLLVLITVIFLAAAWFRVAALVTGFDAAGQQMVSRMMGILAPSILLAGIWGALKTLLDAEGRFFISAVSRAFVSLGVIGAVFVLAPTLGPYSLPCGILIACVIQVVWAAWWLRREGFRYRFVLDASDPRFRRFLSLLGPLLVGSTIAYSLPMIDKLMASHLSEGSIASLSFATPPMAFLTRVAVFSFVTALLPRLSWEAMNRSRFHFQATVARVLGILVFVTLPCSLLLAVLRVPIIRLLYERGRFDPSATSITSDVFAVLALGIMPMAVSVTLSTVFKSLEDTRTPAFLGGGSLLASKITFNLLLVGPLGVVGLGLSSTIQFAVTGTILLIVLRRRLEGIRGGQLANTLIKTSLASLLAVAPVPLMEQYLRLSPAVLIAAGTMAATAIFLVSSAALRIPELLALGGYLLRLKKSPIFSRASCLPR